MQFTNLLALLVQLKCRHGGHFQLLAQVRQFIHIDLEEPKILKLVQLVAAGTNVSGWRPAFGSVSGLLCIDGSNDFAWLTPCGEEVDDDNVILLKGLLELFVSVVFLVNART